MTGLPEVYVIQRRLLGVSCRTCEVGQEDRSGLVKPIQNYLKPHHSSSGVEGKQLKPVSHGTDFPLLLAGRRPRPAQDGDFRHHQSVRFERFNGLKQRCEKDRCASALLYPYSVPVGGEDNSSNNSRSRNDSPLSPRGRPAGERVKLDQMPRPVPRKRSEPDRASRLGYHKGTTERRLLFMLQ